MEPLFVRGLVKRDGADRTPWRAWYGVSDFCTQPTPLLRQPLRFQSETRNLPPT